MDTTRSRRAAAALFSLAVASPLAAQTVGAGRVPSGDSVFVRAVTMGQMDTIGVLVRAMSHEAYGSARWTELSRKIDSLMAAHVGSGAFTFKVSVDPDAIPRGWVGLNMQGPRNEKITQDGEFVTYLAHPSVLSVDPDSPADKAGIVPGDVLLAFNGADVVGREFNTTRLFAPDKKIALTVRRDGENKDYTLDVVKMPDAIFERRIAFSRMPGVPMAPLPAGVVMRVQSDKEHAEVAARRQATEAVAAAVANAPGDRVVVGMAVPRAASGPVVARNGFMIIAPHGVLGADISAVTVELAKALKLEKGVLVNDAPAKSPAYKSGLRTGDVIVNVSGQPVTTVNQLQDLVLTRFGERSVLVQVMRDRKPVALTLAW